MLWSDFHLSILFLILWILPQWKFVFPRCVIIWFAQVGKIFSLWFGFLSIKHVLVVMVKALGRPSDRCSISAMTNQLRRGIGFSAHFHHRGFEMRQSPLREATLRMVLWIKLCEACCGERSNLITYDNWLETVQNGWLKRVWFFGRPPADARAWMTMISTADALLQSPALRRVRIEIQWPQRECGLPRPFQWSDQGLR